MEEPFLTFSNLSNYSEVIHGISNRRYGDMRFGIKSDEQIIKNRQHFFDDLGIKMSNVVVANLSHGTKITQVSLSDRGKGTKSKESAIKLSDGLISCQPGVFLMITAADCLPILIYDPVLRQVAVLHAGWRGIIRQIITQAIEKFKKLGSESQNLIIGIGPSICQRHFIVKNDVLKEFLDIYPAATFVRNNDGYIDLKKAVMVDLKKLGVPQNNVEISNNCPVCHNGQYGSYRKEGENAPALAAIIGIKEKND